MQLKRLLLIVVILIVLCVSGIEPKRTIGINRGRKKGQSPNVRRNPGTSGPDSEFDINNSNTDDIDDLGLNSITTKQSHITRLGDRNHNMDLSTFHGIDKEKNGAWGGPSYAKDYNTYSQTDGKKTTEEEFTYGNVLKQLALWHIANNYNSYNLDNVSGPNNHSHSITH